MQYTSFIFSTNEFNKIKSLLARNIQFYKYIVNSDDTVEIDFGTMISIISSILLKIHISCDLEYLQEIGVGLYNKYKKCLDSFLAIYPDFNIQGKALSGEKAKPIYENMLAKLNNFVPTFPGVFGAEMLVNINNDGPVTIIIDSKNK